MSDLFPDPRRKRSPNINPRADDDVVVLRWILSRTERNYLEVNQPGPSGELGGYQKCENKLIEMIDGNPETTERDKVLFVDKDLLWQLARYIQGYGSGGPNDRLRKAFRRFIGVGH